MHIFALALILPLLSAEGDQLLYNIIIEVKDVYYGNRMCNGCKLVFAHYVNHHVSNVWSRIPNGWKGTFKLNSAMVAELKANGIDYEKVCLSKEFTTTDANGVTQTRHEDLVCQPQRRYTFREACDSSKQVDNFQQVILPCLAGERPDCPKASVQIRIYVETDNGEACPESIVLYNIILELKVLDVGGRTCEGCVFQFTHYIVPRVPGIWSRTVTSTKLTITFNSTMVAELKANGINYEKVCLSKKFNTPDRTGVTQAQLLACQPQRRYSFRELCANRNKPSDAAEDAVLPCLSGEGHDCVNASTKFRIYAETDDGYECPEYNLIIETKEQNYGGRTCGSGCDFFFSHNHRYYRTPIWSRTATSSKGTITLSTTMVIQLKANGFDYEKVCLFKDFTTPGTNGLIPAPQYELACQPQRRYTFRELCANRNRPDAWKLITLPCLDGERPDCPKASIKTRIYVETENGNECPENIVLYNIILETKELDVGGRSCDGCTFFLWYFVQPTGPYVPVVDPVSRVVTKISYSLNAEGVSRLKNNGINYDVCLYKMLVPTNRNGVTRMSQTKLACRGQSMITFRAACAIRNEPQAFTLASLPCGSDEGPDCNRTSFKYRMYVETEHGNPCPDRRLWLSWKVKNVYIHYTCDTCKISFIMRSVTGYSPSLDHAIDISDGDNSNIIRNGVTYTEGWHTGQTPTSSGHFQFVVVAQITQVATLAQLCAGLQTRRTLPCDNDDYCTSISYTIKVQVKADGYETCPSELLE